MTATTAPQDLASRSWSGLMKIAALVALFVVLVAASFAIRNSTADEAVTIVRQAPAVDAVDTCVHQVQTAPC